MGFYPADIAAFRTQEANLLPRAGVAQRSGAQERVQPPYALPVGTGQGNFLRTLRGDEPRYMPKTQRRTQGKLGLRAKLAVDHPLTSVQKAVCANAGESMRHAVSVPFSEGMTFSSSTSRPSSAAR